jgi:hypothetical protein
MDVIMLRSDKKFTEKYTISDYGGVNREFKKR